MQINDTIINASIEDIIRQVKFELSNNGVKLFEKSFDSGNDYMVCCPYHKNGQERRPSAGIRKSDGTFHCFACGKTCSITEVISDCLGYTDAHEGYRWLIRNFMSLEVGRRADIVLDCSRGNNANVPDVVHTKVGEEELDKYRYVHPYMYERGLTDAIIEQFDIGYDKSTDSITFPVRDKNGECMFVARRSVKTKRFDLPKELTKPLYGMYELLTNENFKYSSDLYVCEGLFDCLRLWCNGKLAVAGFGCLFSSYQIKQLQDLPTRSIILALDNDDAGRKATKRLSAIIKNKLVYSVILPEGRKDIGECTDEELNNLEVEPI